MTFPFRIEASRDLRKLQPKKMKLLASVWGEAGEGHRNDDHVYTSHQAGPRVLRCQRSLQKHTHLPNLLGIVVMSVTGTSYAVPLDLIS